MMEGRKNQRSLSAHHFEGLVHILFHSPGANKYAFYLCIGIGKTVMYH